MSYEQTFPSQQERIFKIIVVGDSGVGKTCLSYRFCEGKFQKPETTVGVDFRDKVVLVDNEPIKLQLWDTAGQERFRQSMVAHYYRNAHAVVFVYDVTSMESFNNLTHWIDELKENLKNHSHLAKILVGNQCDLIGKKAVSTSMAQKFADSYDMPLFETSAADDNELSTINAIFMTLAHKLKNQKPFTLRPLHQANRIQLNSAPTDTEDKKNSSSSSSCC